MVLQVMSLAICKCAPERKHHDTAGSVRAHYLMPPRISFHEIGHAYQMSFCSPFAKRRHDGESTGLALVPRNMAGPGEGGDLGGASSYGANRVRRRSASRCSARGA